MIEGVVVAETAEEEVVKEEPEPGVEECTVEIKKVVRVLVAACNIFLMKVPVSRSQ